MFRQNQVKHSQGHLWEKYKQTGKHDSAYPYKNRETLENKGRTGFKYRWAHQEIMEEGKTLGTKVNKNK